MANTNVRMAYSRGFVSIMVFYRKKYNTKPMNSLPIELQFFGKGLVLPEVMFLYGSIRRKLISHCRYLRVAFVVC